MKDRVSFNPTSIGTHQELATTLTSVAIEASPKQDHKRVYEYELVVTDEGKVVNPQLDPKTDIKDHLRWNTELDQRESKVAIQIRDALIEKPDKTVAIWFSPPNQELGYKEGRINVGFKTTKDGIIKSQSYGIVTTETSPLQMLIMSDLISEFSNDLYRTNDPEDLRDKPVFIQLPLFENNPWQFLHRYIQLDSILEIIEGEVSKRNSEVERASQEVANIIIPKLRAATTYQEQLFIVQQAEEMMAQKGYKIDHNRVCDSISISGNSVHTHTAFNANGQVIHTNTEIGTYVKKCPYCNKSINAVIHPGYKCSCGQVYTGVC